MSMQGTLEYITDFVLISSPDSNQVKQRIVNSTTFTFSRTSAQGVSPLITTLSIDSVNTGLNGTVVYCLDVANPMTLASTTIQILDITMISELANHISLSAAECMFSYYYSPPVHSNIDHYGGVFN